MCHYVYIKGVYDMTFKELRLLNLLCTRLGIETVQELEEFKRQYKADNNKMLLDRLAMYSIAKYKRVY